MNSQSDSPNPYRAASNDSTSPERGNEDLSGSDRHAKRVKGQLSDLAQSAKTHASAAMQPIAKNARGLAEEQKERGAARIGDIAQAVRGTANEIADDVPFAAEYIHAVAGKLDDAAGLLRDNSVEDLAQKALDFAEERPVLFIGGAIAAGFLVSRLLRSSVDLEDAYE